MFSSGFNRDGSSSSGIETSSELTFQKIVMILKYYNPNILPEWLYLDLHSFNKNQHPEMSGLFFSSRHKSPFKKHTARGTDRYVSDRPGYRDRERDQRRDQRGEICCGRWMGNLGVMRIGWLDPLVDWIPSRELTYPTLGKGKSSSKCHFGGYVNSQEGIFHDDVSPLFFFWFSHWPTDPLRFYRMSEQLGRSMWLLSCFASKYFWKFRIIPLQPTQKNKLDEVMRIW